LGFCKVANPFSLYLLLNLIVNLEFAKIIREFFNIFIEEVDEEKGNGGFSIIFCVVACRLRWHGCFGETCL